MGMGVVVPERLTAGAGIVQRARLVSALLIIVMVLAVIIVIHHKCLLSVPALSPEWAVLFKMCPVPPRNRHGAVFISVGFVSWFCVSRGMPAVSLPLTRGTLFSLSGRRRVWSSSPMFCTQYTPRNLKQSERLKKFIACSNSRWTTAQAEKSIDAPPGLC